MAESDLSQQIERIDKKMQDIEDAQKRKGTIGIIMPIILLVVALGMIAYALSPVYEIYDNPEKLQASFQEKAEERLLPKLKTEGELLANEVLPEYQKAAEKVASERRSEIADKVNKEANILYTNLTDQLTTKFQTFTADFSESEYEYLIQEFPELTELDSTPDPSNPDLRKSDMIAQGVMSATQRMSNDLFSVHFKALDKLELEFNRIEPTDNVSNMTDEELKTFLADNAIELFKLKIDPATTAQ